MSKTYKWLNRRVAKQGPYLALCLTPKEFESAGRRCGVRGLSNFPEAGAQMTLLENRTGDLCAIVAISVPAQQRDPIEIAGLLVHEAVHVWQAHKRDIGEEKPGDELEAYAIQGISQELLAEYARRIVLTR